MRGADILLLTSLSEGLPMAAIEALDSGLAIVSSRIGGVSDVVEDAVNGALCDLTPESFAAALHPLLSDARELSRRREASSLRASRFDIRSTAESYERILRCAAKS